MAERVRVGLFGAGNWARVAHLHDFTLNERTEVVDGGTENQGSFDDGAWVQVAINAVELSYRSRAWVDLPLDGV